MWEQSFSRVAQLANQPPTAGLVIQPAAEDSVLLVLGPKRSVNPQPRPLCNYALEILLLA